MKLGNYFQQSKPVKRKRETAIIVTNEHVKKDFTEKLKIKTEEVRELEKELEHSKNRIQTGTMNYDDLQKRHNELLQEQQEYGELGAEVFRLRTDLGKANLIAQKVPDLEGKITKLSIKRDELLAESNQFEHQGISFKEQAVKVSNEYTKLQEHANSLQDRLSIYEHEHPVTIKENTELLSQVKHLQQQTTQQLDDINLLTDNFFYWKDVASSLEDQLSSEATLRDELQRGLEILKKGSQLSTKKITKSSKAYKEAEEEIVTLNNRNLELTKFTDQLSKIILEQKRKLASAGQLSQGQVQATEGFNMPFAKENLRTKQLGNAKPTLLKFKETYNDNN